MQPMQPTTQANIAGGPNVGKANDMVQGNQMFVKQINFKHFRIIQSNAIVHGEKI